MTQKHPDLPFSSQHCLIGGQWRPAQQSESLQLLNPSTGAPLCEIAKGDAADIDDCVEAAARALQGPWGRSTALARGRLLARLGQLVTEHADILAELESLDVGKPRRQAAADAGALARYLEFYAGAADKIHGETLPYMEGYTVYTLREPHGITGHIIPWNYPMQIIGRSVGAALAMGNVCILKPAEEACLTALMFAELARRAGLPDGVLNVVPGNGHEAGRALASHPGINHISFTGSVPVGAEIQASAARNIVPVTLELGGKSPQLVFNDADLDAALPFLLNAGIQNAGQTCSASSRLLVQRGIYQEVVDKLSASYQALQVGPAMEDLDVGPLISDEQRARVQQFIDQAADLSSPVCGVIKDNAPAGGFYFAPHLYSDVAPDHVLAQQEIFGPVQVIIPFDEEEEAVAIANGTEFGLVASVWSRDGARQFRLARAIRSGQVFINNYGAGGGVELPFGGTGKSGHGREKGFEALYGFSVLKTVATYHG
jgi:aldehyde dehydrogenase (NAD+)